MQLLFWLNCLCTHDSLIVISNIRNTRKIEEYMIRNIYFDILIEIKNNVRCVYIIFGKLLIKDHSKSKSVGVPLR